MHIHKAVARHPVVTFYLLAFVLSWAGWVPQTLHARGILSWDSPLLALLGGGGPTLAAVIVLLLRGERAGIRRIFASLLKVRVSARWFVFVLCFWFVVVAIALGIEALLGRALPAVGAFPWGSLLPIVVTMVLSNVWEEIGWRGFALPRLQERYGDLAIAGIMGLLWSVWHLPLLLNPSSPMASLPWYGEILFSLALTVIYTWLYRGTGASLFFVTLFHALANTVAFVLVELGAFVRTYPAVVGLTTLAALVIVLRSGPERFTFTSVRQTGDD